MSLALTNFPEYLVSLALINQVAVFKPTIWSVPNMPMTSFFFLNSRRWPFSWQVSSVTWLNLPLRKLRCLTTNDFWRKRQKFALDHTQGNIVTIFFWLVKSDLFYKTRCYYFLSNHFLFLFSKFWVKNVFCISLLKIVRCRLVVLRGKS